MFFQSRQKQIQEQIELYCRQITRTMTLLRESLQAYFQSDDRDELRENYRLIHKAESHADDLRYEIEVTMYTKGVFPESREDILELLERLDKVPNAAESCVRQILHEHVTLPDQFVHQTLELTRESEKCVESLLEATRKVFSDFHAAGELVGNIDQLESRCDQMEADLVEAIYTGDLDGFEKITVRDLVQRIEKIADRAEAAGATIRLITAKRRF
jgi:hypothetical protein